ncbi:uncharacterized protein B0I36DRAFT_110895 [Microdochium trichocladiopsis]|uniref:Uncharacterized protein n=1 Tax=Microdochium trichocladiopsis TaxID=1682393 RepID=A0A9P8Y7I4_9PEZI|nr:uncharacterized protein B0I36DRAFT_110895 [Microdochium trichocladiopsis]KAH7033615.1 hypothetical protein B0I36DRAFT_110895 [Microdochium trichocladiopsis]
MAPSSHFGQSSYSHDRHNKRSKSSRHPSKPRVDLVHREHSGAVDFLFAVIELGVSDGYIVNPLHDTWGNPLPPSVKEEFTHSWGEPQVYRYKDGDVFEASDYAWRRGANNNLDEDVLVYRFTSDRSGSEAGPVYCESYGTGWTLFNCGPFVPAVVAHTDVTNCTMVELGNVLDPASDAYYNAWGSLRLEIDGPITRVGTSADSPKHIAPPASWIPSIVPEPYRSTDPRSPPEGGRGLGGQFGIIIGLMALGQAPGRLREAFTTTWRGYRWLARRDDLAFTGFPRGVLVHIAVDPTRQDPETAFAAIAYAEACEAIILDNTGATSHPHSRHSRR